MSLDLALVIDTGGPEPARVWDEWNCTHNINPMWVAALPSGQTLGAFLEGKTAAEALPGLRAALAAMEDNPTRFRALEPANGIGNGVVPQQAAHALRLLLPVMERAA